MPHVDALHVAEPFVGTGHDPQLMPQ